MAQKIQIKRSAVQGRVPGTADLDLGELAINTFDGKVFLKKNDGAEGIVGLSNDGHGHALDELSKKTYTVTVPNFSTEPYIRIATLDLSDTTKIRPVVVNVRATTANNTVTETMLRISVTPATGTPGFAISSITAHSANSDTSAEAGWVIRYARLSYTGTMAFLDISKYVANSITMEVTPLTVNGWAWVEGEVSVTSAAGSGSTTCTLAQGLRANTTYANSAGSADYCSYGIYGARSLSSTVDYSGQWSYIGYVVMTYNSSYLRGHAINTEIVVREIAAAEQRLPSEFIVAKVNLKATLASHSGSAEFNSFVPKIAIEVDEMGGLVLPEDFAAVCTATSTSSKTIRLYMRNKLPNDHYEVLCQNRYGAAYHNTSYAHTTSYCIFYHTSNQTPITTLPTPALGAVVYGTSRRRALAYLDESIYHPGNKPSPGDLGAATADHNHTLAGLSEKSYNSLTDTPSLLALGETSVTAYRGDRGKTAYDHSQVAHAPSNAQKNSDITKAEIEAKLTGAITTHTHSYLPLSGGTLTGDLVATANQRVRGLSVIQSGYVESAPVNFRFDQDVLRYLNRKTGPTFTLTGFTSGEMDNLFSQYASFINLKDRVDGCSIEVTGFSFDNSANSAWWPYVLCHSSVSGLTVRLEVKTNNVGTPGWQQLYEGPVTTYLIADVSCANGALIGARWTFFGHGSNNTYIRSIGVIGRNSSAFAWNVMKGGDTMYGDLNFEAGTVKVAGSAVLHAGNFTDNSTSWNTAYTHSQAAHAPSTAQKNSDITKAEIEAKLTGAVTTHTHSYEPANANIQAHVTAAHAPSNAQKNSDITKAEIEAKLTGTITSHTHEGMLGHDHDDRYYTETETNTLLASKSDVGHAHPEAVVTISPSAGVLDLSAVQSTTVQVPLTGNVTSIVLPAGTAGVRKDLLVQFVQDATGGRTVSGWPSMLVEGGVVPGLNKAAGGMTNYGLTNTNNTGWVMHVDENRSGLPMLKIPVTRRHIAGASAGTALTTQALTANRIYYIPFTVPRAYTLVQLGVAVSTASAGSGRLGIYANDGESIYDKPGTLLAEGVSTLSTGTTGTKVVTVDLTLEPGEIYWAALINTSAATLRALAVAAQEPSLGWTDNSTTVISYMYESGSGGALPSFCSATLLPASGNCPAIYLCEF